MAEEKYFLDLIIDWGAKYLPARLHPYKYNIFATLLILAFLIFFAYAIGWVNFRGFLAFQATFFGVIIIFVFISWLLERKS